VLRQDFEFRKIPSVGLPMFCRICYYDLRGQQIPRCPECGTPFAFDDPSSFLRKNPGRFARLSFWLRRRRRVLLATLTILLLVHYAVGGSQLRRFPQSLYPASQRLLATTNLKSILSIWAIQANDDPQQTEFDIDAVRQVIGRRISAWSEVQVAKLERLMIFAPFFVVPTMAYLVMVAILVGRWRRREAVILLATLAAMLFCLGYGCSVHVREMAIWCRGSHAFLNDYVYLSWVDYTCPASQAMRTIVAYDVHSFRRPGRRLIGFADCHVAWLSDEQARPLFEAQGIPYPGQTD
jgi:hypothetical protein